jgi:hypothetical protein
MAKFEDVNVGDTVRTNYDFRGAAKVGATGKVVRKDSYSKWIAIEWVRDGLDNGQMNGSYSSSYFDVIPTGPAGEFILIVKQNGKYKPADTPRVYPSEAQAMAVAKRMAEQNPGEDFVVFKTLAKVNVPPPTKADIVRFA